MGSRGKQYIRGKDEKIADWVVSTITNASEDALVRGGGTSNEERSMDYFLSRENFA